MVVYNGKPYEQMDDLGYRSFWKHLFRGEEKKWVTLPEANIAPENGWLEYYFPIGGAYFQGLC